MRYPQGVFRTTAAKLAGFAVALGVLFGAAALAGETVGPDRDGGGESDADAHGMSAEAREGGTDVVRGLAVSADGLSVALERAELERGRPSELRFRIEDAEGEAVRDFELEHDKRMHLIVVRRDGRGFQHLHPKLGSEGTWSVPVTLSEPGSYRVFADFKRGGEARTLAADLSVDGAADYRPLPEPALTAGTGDGYEVRIDARRVRAGRDAELAFHVTRDGREVETEPYLGARGHLVALREGDLAFLHVHPDENALAFLAEFPSAGRHRLYLQFKYEGRVHTAEFTQDVSR
ncbi:MAG TPA: hypothetical protein VF056_12840 [Thermoleophilaceae bacterium]